MSELKEIILPLVEQSTADPAEVAECKAGRIDMVTRYASAYEAEPPTVERADPALLIDAQLLWSIIDGRTPWISYDRNERLIKISATNGTWIYRVGKPATENRAIFCMRRPD